MDKEQGRTERVRRALEILSRPMEKLVDKSKGREEIDNFFTKEIVPRLARLSHAGRLPDLSMSPPWLKAENLWDSLSEDSPRPTPINEIKAAMLSAVRELEK